MHFDAKSAAHFDGGSGLSGRDLEVDDGLAGGTPHRPSSAIAAVDGQSSTTVNACTMPIAACGRPVSSSGTRQKAM